MSCRADARPARRASVSGGFTTHFYGAAAWQFGMHVWQDAGMASMLDSDAQPAPGEHAAQSAAAVLWRALYRDVGRRGTLMEQPDGESFLLRTAFGDGVAHTPHRLLGPLPGGDVVSHEARLAIGWDGGPQLYVDVLHEAMGWGALKVAAFDALHLGARAEPCHGVLVFLRGAGRMHRDDVESVAYPHGFLYGMHEDEARDERGFAALRRHVSDWLADHRP